MIANFILPLEIILILTVCVIYFLKYRRQKGLIQILCECLLLAVAFGTPILFTSITRSVFEVTKMYLLRFSQLSIVFLMFTQMILGKNSSKIFFWNRPIQTKEEKILLSISLAWCFSNLLSFLFSPNQLISWIGAYDRWEGVLTVLNYVIILFLMIKFFQNKTFLYWFIGALLISGGLTSIYGIYQSTGRDFMNWSVDPTARVFASINNPVHFSAYIAMLVPLCMGSFLYFIKNKNLFPTFDSIKKLHHNQMILIAIGLYLLFIVLHYAGNFVSFGRATWIGFSSALMFFFFYSLNLYIKEKIETSSLTFYLGMFLTTAILTFKVHETSATAGIGVLSLVLLFLGLLLFLYQKEKIKLLKIIGLLVFCCVLQFNTVDLMSILVNIIILVGFIFSLKLEKDKELSMRAALLYLLMAGLMITLVIPSVRSLYIREVFNRQVNKKVYELEKKFNREITVSENYMIRAQINDQLLADNVISKTEANIYYRTDTYASNLKTGTARTSMWRSGIGLSITAFKDPNNKFWLKEHPLIGTGPGTIKAFFPKYRRPEYGRLEGGHNFTPDKLHNDYINLIATNGLFGFFVYYGLFLPFCMLIFARYLKSQDFTEESKLLVIGAMSGVVVYLGQVMFNFGVVATRILFYELLAIVVAIGLNKTFYLPQKKIDEINP